MDKFKQGEEPENINDLADYTEETPAAPAAEAPAPVKPPKKDKKKSGGSAAAKKGSFLKSRKFKYGTFATIFVAAVLVGVVLLNVISTVLVERYPLKVDLTAGGKYEVTQETTDFLKTLDQEVTINVLAKEDDFTINQYLIQANEIIKKYQLYSDKVKVEYIDLVSTPEFAAKYPQFSNMQTGNLIITSGDKAKMITPSDMFNMDQSGNVLSSKAEYTLTSLIVAVTTDDQPVVTLISGHEEKEAAALTDLLEKNNFELGEETNIVTNEISPDATFAILNAPQRDFTNDEITRLEKWLLNDQKYGKQLFYLADPAQPELPNLEGFLAEWGINVGKGVVGDTDTNNMPLVGNAYMTMLNYSESTYAGDLPARGFFPVTFNSRPLSVGFQSKDNTSTTGLLNFADTVFIRPTDAGEDFNGKDNISEDTVGALAMGTKVRYDEDVRSTSNIIVSGSSYFIDAMFLSGGASSFSNSEYLVNLFNQLIQRESTLQIIPKDIGATQLEINANQAMTMFWIFTVSLPIIILIGGIVVWLRRRHK